MEIIRIKTQLAGKDGELKNCHTLWGRTEMKYVQEASFFAHQLLDEGEQSLIEYNYLLSMKQSSDYDKLALWKEKVMQSQYGTTLS